MIERVYKVAGMHCQSCVAMVKEEVEEIDGVEAVDVDLAGGSATVRLDPGRVSDVAVVDAIREAGYEATPS
jgi:copper chaperone